jgi:hypothetical protein
VAGDVFHRQVKEIPPFAGVIKRCDAGMAESGSGTGFPKKALAMTFVGCHAGAEHLDRHRAVEARVAGMVHLAHAARSQETDDLIRT